MKDNPISKFVRGRLDLPANWRVYQVESVKNFTAVKLTGSLVRPVDSVYEPHIKRDFEWIKPAMGKAQVTISNEEYDQIFKNQNDGEIDES
jgi:hypothetical protein